MKPENLKYSPGKILIDTNAIRERVEEMAGEIASAYKGKDVVIVALLDGSFMFLADLARCLFGRGMPVCLEFVSVSSYGAGVESSGKLVFNEGKTIKLRDRNVIILDDILDTGLTMSGVVDLIKKERPSDIRICVFLDKPSRRNIPVSPDYTGFKIDDIFVVGYGLDYDGKYRCLPYIAELNSG